MQITDINPIILDRFVEIAIIGVLFWLAIHTLYDKGLLGPWPPARLGGRLLVWILALFPLITGFGIIGVALFIGIAIPSTESLTYLVIASAEFLGYLSMIFLLSLIYFRLLRWSWRGYGAAALTVVISTTFSAGVILTVLGVLPLVDPEIFGLVDTVWRTMSFMLICWLYDTLKAKNRPKTEQFNEMGQTRGEVGIGSIYSVIIPLVRRIRVDRDEQALLTLQAVLQLNSGLERSLSLACKALGFDRNDILQITDVGRASETLQYVETDWGTFSRLDFSVLFFVSGVWVICLLLSAIVYVYNAARQYYLLFVLDFVLPFGIAMILSLGTQRKSGREYDLAKRHDESFRFTHNEFKQRRSIDFLVIIIAILGTTAITLISIAYGLTPLGALLMVPLSMVYVLSVVPLLFDGFARGVRPLPEEATALIEKQFRKKIP
ncbi:MAG: hypothetical protein ACFFE2_10270 [Candidatus Thorarchaeota archaeon]